MLQAIKMGLIPREVVNGVVNTYPVWKMPQLNVQRLEQALQVKVIYDSRLLAATQENTREMKKVHKAIQQIQMKFNLDGRGFSAELTNFQDAERINKKS